jgi:hypothetical protein
LFFAIAKVFIRYPKHYCRGLGEKNFKDSISMMMGVVLWQKMEDAAAAWKKLGHSEEKKYNASSVAQKVEFPFCSCAHQNKLQVQSQQSVVFLGFQQVRNASALSFDHLERFCPRL